MHWSEWTTSISHVIYQQDNHHQSQLQYTQGTCKALSSPRIPPCITSMASLWATFPSTSAPISLSLHHATTLLHPSRFLATPLSLTATAIFPSLPYNCIPPLFSNFNHCLWQSCMPLHKPPFPTTVCWGCTTPLHDRLPFYSLFENPFLVTYLHPLLSVPGIFPLQLNVHFVIHSDLTFLAAIPPFSLSQLFIPTFSLHLVCSLLNVIMFIYPHPPCSDLSSLLPEWSALCVYEEYPDLVATYLTPRALFQPTLSSHQARKDVKQPIRVWATPALEPQLITDEKLIL